MRTFQVSEELYEQLKSFVIDPFDDTPDVVIGRLIEIVKKARNHWSPFEAYEPPQQEVPLVEPPQRQAAPAVEEQEVIL
ncbi:MAG: hypothetical protein A2Y76_00610 [Planctomycetes bacterium RBG_13_60_9]|nr:MAG: hypothetical protein A2Y76_00610 [Planctomycetes bacterium RBG_13_60_9]